MWGFPVIKSAESIQKSQAIFHKKVKEHEEFAPAVHSLPARGYEQKE